VILPFNCNDYAKQLRIEFDTLLKYYQTQLPESNSKSELKIMDYAIKNFTIAAELFHKRLERLDKTK
jgi:hypothetical protein